MIAIIDYGLGNIQAIENIYKKINVPFSVARTVEDLSCASKLILPGVGAFDQAMKELKKSGMIGALNELVLRKKIPVLGICVGMQIMTKKSEEGKLDGLGWIEAEVKKIDVSNSRTNLYLPQMGWNNISPLRKDGLLDNLDYEKGFYFLHSFCISCENKCEVIAITDYGEKFASVINSGNIYGVQFHPEKSHNNGVELLRNFANL